MRLKPLDVLRGTAILLVLVRHIPVPLPKMWPYVLLRPFQLGGWIGVDLFFVLSGYLVSGLLFDEYRATGRTDPKRFLIRRGFRIYPAYYALLIFSVIMSWKWVRFENVLVEGFFLQGYFFTKWAMWNHTWTLAIEEHFYFMLAFLLWGLSKRGGKDPFRPLIPLAAAVAVFCLSMRLSAESLEAYKLFVPTHVRIDSLFFGALLSYLSRFHEGFRPFVRRHRWTLLAAGFAAIFPAFIRDVSRDLFLSVEGLTLLYLGFGAWVAASVEFGAGPSFLRPLTDVIAFIGRNSYSIYLWHMPVNKLAMPRLHMLFGELPPWLDIGLFLFLSIAIGIASSAVLEKPFLRLRDRLFPSPVA